jgi:hypothetical protein
VTRQGVYHCRPHLYFHYLSHIIIIIITSLTFKLRLTFIIGVINIIISMLLLDILILLNMIND